MTFEEVADKVGPETAQRLRQITLDVYTRGFEIAAKRGIIIADTKIELGWDADGELVLGDEVLTPDSSRFWPADEWQPGRPQASYDTFSSWSPRSAFVAGVKMAFGRRLPSTRPGGRGTPHTLCTWPAVAW